MERATSQITTSSHAALRSLAIHVAAAWSGFFVMGVELLGGRMLAPYFGSSVFVWGALIAVFMACLAVGYLLGGQASLRAPTPARLGVLLAAAALLALPIVFADTWALEPLSFAVADPRYGSLLASLALFGGPAVVSGMVSPYAVRLLVDDLAGSGRSAGRLYFASTLGSAAGTILTSFYLVLWFAIDTLILGFVAISLAVAAMLWLYGARARGA
jgi:hypothetical protein